MYKHYIKKSLTWAFLFISTMTFAQNEETKKEEYRFKTVKVENGVKTVIDTSFDSKEEMHKYMTDQGINMHHLPSHMDIEHEDGESNGDRKMVKKIMRYEITVKDSMHDFDHDALSDEDQLLLHKVINEKMLHIEDADFDMENPEEIRKYFQLGEEGADIQIIVIKHHIEINEITAEEQKSAKLVEIAASERLEMKVSPNPAENEISISLSPADGQDNAHAQISILDMSGKLVKTVEKEIFSNQIQLNVEDLAQGSYILQLISNDRSAVKKIIIQ